MILAGDIGGTKTNLALFETAEGSLGSVLAQRTFRSTDYDSLESLLLEFVSENRQPPIREACFGIAGPVVQGYVETPNLAWKVGERNVADALGLSKVRLINDLEATAYGIEALGPHQIHTLNEGEERPGTNRALIAAGTGLGMAGILWHEERYHPIPSEGGHMDFAPRNDHEVELLKYLMGKFDGRVSYERALSGPGLFNIYSFLRDTKFAEEPEWLAAEIQSSDKSAAVSRAALEEKSELAVKAMDMFVSIYGSMAGNLALMLVATNGVYLCGGITPKILEKLKTGSFMKAFTHKGRFSSMVSKIPVRVVLDPCTALYGAALSALH